MRSSWVVLIAAVVATSAAASPAKVPDLASHRAIYDISLARTEPGGMVAATGRTVIQFRDTCNGWSTIQRFVADMTNAQGDPARTDFVATSWESKDGTRMRFSVKNSVDGKMQQRFEGTAIRASHGKGEVKLNVPRGRKFTLPVEAIMPTEHTLDILRAAAAGANGMHHLVFQGGDRSDLYDALAVIGRPLSAAELASDRAEDKMGLLSHVGAHTVLISYYAYGSRSPSPEYEVAYRLYDNGIVSSMSLIYSNFTLRAKLVGLDKLTPSCRTR